MASKFVKNPPACVFENACNYPTLGGERERFIPLNLKKIEKIEKFGKNKILSNLKVTILHPDLIEHINVADECDWFLVKLLRTPTSRFVRSSPCSNLSYLVVQPRTSESAATVERHSLLSMVNLNHLCKNMMRHYLRENPLAMMLFKKLTQT